MCVDDCQYSLFGKSCQQVHFLRTKGTGFGATNSQSTYETVVVDQWHRSHRTCKCWIDIRETRIMARIIDDKGFTMLSYPTRRTMVFLELGMASFVISILVGCECYQLVLFRI